MQLKRFVIESVQIMTSLPQTTTNSYSSAPTSVPTVSRARVAHWLLLLVVCLTPVIVSIVLVSSHYHITDFAPNFNDEISYWRQILTFKEVGFSGGYYSYLELPPPAEFTHFFAYGPWYPMIYGLLARVIGWNFLSMIILNCLFVTLALMFFCWAVGMDNRQLVVTGLMLGTFGGLLMFLFTGMQEPFQQTIAILIAAIFYQALQVRNQITYRWWIGGIVLITIAGVLRLSWAILFIPYLFLTGRRLMLCKGLYVVLSLVLTAAIVTFSNFTVAPTNHSVFNVLGEFKTSFGGGLQNLLIYFGANVANWFYSHLKTPADYVQSVQVVVLAILLFATLFMSYRYPKRAGWRTDSLFHLYNLIGVLVASCALYVTGTGGDYRVVATHLMLTLLLLIARRQYAGVVLIIVSSLLFSSVLLSDYFSYLKPKYNPDHSDYIEFENIAARTMIYRPDAANAWCNTLLFQVELYETNIAGAPPGFGLTFFVDPADPRLTFKSQYLLLDDASYQQVTQRSDAPQLKWLADAPTGKLYLNQSSQCGQSVNQ
ncbi:MAG: hypothetical protein R3E39_16250 [Anaerolineae bacterium]